MQISGVFIALDDIISHIRQGIFLYSIQYGYEVRGEKVIIKGNSYDMPQFLIHTVLYKYLKIHKLSLIRNVTNFLNGV